MDAQIGINSKLSSLVSATNMQNALQAKANASSNQLMEDVKYVRGLAEAAERRRVKNQ